MRLISETGSQIGIVSIDEALRIAENAGLDLVEVSPDSKPPVCRVLDYGKMKYEDKKKKRESKKKQHVIQIKEVRFRPNISTNDFETKINKAKKFFGDGNKVKITIMLRGREMRRKDLADSLAVRIEEALNDVAEVGKRGKFEGNRISMVMSPK